MNKTNLFKKTRPVRVSIPRKRVLGSSNSNVTTGLVHRKASVCRPVWASKGLRYEFSPEAYMSFASLKKVILIPFYVSFHSTCTTMNFNGDMCRFTWELPRSCRVLWASFSGIVPSSVYALYTHILVCFYHRENRGKSNPPKEKNDVITRHILTGVFPRACLCGKCWGVFVASNGVLAVCRAKTTRTTRPFTGSSLMSRMNCKPDTSTWKQRADTSVYAFIYSMDDLDNIHGRYSSQNISNIQDRKSGRSLGVSSCKFLTNVRGCSLLLQ